MKFTKINVTGYRDKLGMLKFLRQHECMTLDEIRQVVAKGEFTLPLKETFDINASCLGWVKDGRGEHGYYGNAEAKLAELDSIGAEYTVTITEVKNEYELEDERRAALYQEDMAKLISTLRATFVSNEAEEAQNSFAANAISEFHDKHRPIAYA